MKKNAKNIVRVAFISAYDIKQDYQRSLPPLGIGYLISIIRRDCWFTEPLFCLSLDELIDAKPDIVGISSTSEMFNEAIKIARQVKETSDAVVLLGGPHISGLPKFLPDVFDIGIIGEGEETLKELLTLYYTSTIEPSNLLQIKGISYRDNGVVRMTEQRPLISSLDDLPYPDRDALKYEEWAIPQSEQIHMITSRGCPYSCTFCASSRIWRKYREFSSDYVVREMEMIINRYHPEEIYFFDDLFIASKKRFREIAQKIREREIHKEVCFRSYARVDLMTEEMADIFSELNFRYIDFGFESNSKKILDYFKKRNVTPDLNQRAIDQLKTRNISIGANFIIGSPIETNDDIRATYEFIERNANDIDRISFGPLFPIPGTPFWEYARERGIVTEDEQMDWFRLAFNPDNFDINYFPYLGEHISKEDFPVWVGKFTALCKEIILKGYIRRLEHRLRDKTLRLEKVTDELARLRGSRLLTNVDAIRKSLRRFLNRSDT